MPHAVTLADSDRMDKAVKVPVLYRLGDGKCVEILGGCASVHNVTVGRKHGHSDYFAVKTRFR